MNDDSENENRHKSARKRGRVEPAPAAAKDAAERRDRGGSRRQSGPPARRDPDRARAAIPVTGGCPGAAAFAAEFGVEPDDVLAVAACLLAAAAGPSAVAATPWGWLALPGLHLVARERHRPLRRVIEALATPLRLLNTALATRMARYNPPLLDGLEFGVTPPEQPGRLPAVPDEVTERHREALRETELRLELGEEEAPGAPAGMEHRREAVLHPCFLLENASPAELPDLLRECNRLSALGLRVRIDLERPAGRDEAAGLVRLLDGSLLPPRETNRWLPRVEGARQASLRLILAPDEATYGALAARVPGLLARCVLLTGGSPDAGAASPAPGSVAAREFFDRFQNALADVVEHRRNRPEPMPAAWSGAALGQLEAGLRAYESECDTLPVDPGSGVEGLPRTLAWALWFLGRAGSGPEADETERAGAALAAARRLRDRHVAELTRLLGAAKEAEEWELAVAVRERVRSGPLSGRSLSRSFSTGRFRRLGPVVAALEEAGVLVRDKESRLVAGEVSLADAEDGLRERFRTLEPRDRAG